MKKKFILRTNPHEEETPTVELALRSSLPGLDTGDDGCAQTFTDPCYISCSVPLEINTGDIVYNSGMTVFNGNNKYFNIYLQVWDISEGTRVVQINSSGVILGIYSICAI